MLIYFQLITGKKTRAFVKNTVIFKSERPDIAVIVEYREQIAREFDFDLERYLDYLQLEEQKHPERVLRKEDLMARAMASGQAEADGNTSS